MLENLKIIFIFHLLVAISVFFAGCAGKKTEPETKLHTPEMMQHASSSKKIKKVPHRILNEPARAFNAKPVITVRVATDSELSSVPGIWQGKEVAGFSVLGVGSLGLGLIAPPLYASALVVGGILLVAMPSSAGAFEGIQRKKIERVLKTVDFSKLTHDAVIDLLGEKKESTQDDPRLTILILVYGFTQKFADIICFSVDAQVDLHFNGEEIYKDFIYIEPYLRSADAPPPHCATVGEFAENQGALAKQTIDDFSVILANIVAHRLPVLSWKKY